MIDGSDTTSSLAEPDLHRAVSALGKGLTAHIIISFCYMGKQALACFKPITIVLAGANAAFTWCQNNCIK